MTREYTRRAAALAALSLAGLLAGGAAGADPAAGPPSRTPVVRQSLAGKMDSVLARRLSAGAARGSESVILRTGGALTAAQGARLRALGADVTRHLDFIGSVAATIPSRSLARIAALPFVTHLSSDGLVRKCDEFTEASSGAGAAYQQSGLTGKGVTVAVLDSGIVCAHWDLQGGGVSRVKASKDFVNGYTDWRLLVDYCGHGTHVAGIIAGDGTASTGGQCFRTYYGTARAASLVSVRVLDQNGQGTVGNVIAGIQWVVQNKSAYGIRVLNVSLGHPVSESYTSDPLCWAVEAAWKAGIVVVCAAGNDGRAGTAQSGTASNEGWGTNYGSINSPGNDPYVITVGATKSTDGSRTHDRIATYSGRGPSRIDLILKPDIIAPGNKVTSLNVDWATLSANYGTTNLIPYKAYTTATPSGAPGTLGANSRDWVGLSNAYFVLSGTSMATPVIAGAAALLLQKYPRLTPDTVKARLMISADKWAAPDGTLDPCTYGAGYLNVPAALANTAVPTQSALSPTLTEDSQGNVCLNTSQMLSASKAIWGTAGLTDPYALWGTRAIYGTTTLSASRAIYGSSTLRDTSVWVAYNSSVDLSSVAVQGE